MPTPNGEIDGGVGAEKFHTLTSREIRPDRNWHELIMAWQGAKTSREMLGILHGGFNVPLDKASYEEKEYDEIDRLTFYFTIADGWNDESMLQLPTDQRKAYDLGSDAEGRSIHKTPSDLRQDLARKAFDMLCSRFFKMELGNQGGQGFDWRWENRVVSERLFPVIQHFFRSEPSSFGRMRLVNLRLSPLQEKWSHSEEVAVNFLLNLTQFLWERKTRGDVSGDKMHARIKAAKPWMIEVLDRLNRLDLLERWMDELDKPCVAKLKEIALRSKLEVWEHPVSENRLAITLEEACYVGSKAALFLLHRGVRLKERARLTAIKEAQQRLENARAQVAKLASKR